MPYIASRKYTEEELSRILGEADAGHLKTGGGYCWEVDQTRGDHRTACCINQAAYNEPGLGDSIQLNVEPASKFDRLGNDVIADPEALLRVLEEGGWA